ncbi:MAG: fibronectin type III domain-containing protein, partial [Paludibacteraceae bacterium]|nr:fibronectin type III domain-containing protein [Paludibacteraceae bacterium]
MNAFLRKSFFMLVAILCTTFINAQYRYIDASFDTDIPSDWTQQSTAQSNVWTVVDSVAVLQGQALDAVTALVSPSVDIAEVVEPIFRFKYRNEQFDGKLNDFTVSARIRPDTAWVVLFQSSSRVKHFSLQEFIIPDSLKSETFQLMFEVKNNGGDITAIDNVTLANSKSCVSAPTNLVITDLSQSFAKIAWNTDSVAVNTRISIYEIVQKENKKTNTKEVKELVYNETMTANNMVNVYEAKNLKPGQDYRAYVLADCEYGDTSAYATIDFTTICDVWSIRYFDDFEDYAGSDLDCWRVSGKSPSYTPMIDSTIAQSGKKSLKFYTYIDYYAYAYTPQFDVEDISTMAISFYVYSDKVSSSAYSSELVVGVLTNPADPSTFTPVHTVSPSQDKVWQRVDVSLKEYDGDAYGNYGKYIAFRSGNAEQTNYIWIDDVTLDKIGCFAPQLITIDKVTGREFELSWTEMGLSKSWNVKVSKTELDSAGLTKPALIDLTVDTTHVAIDKLEPNSKYYAYIQSECGAWIPDPVVIETKAIWAVNYHDNMTSYKTTVPADWTTDDISMVTGTSYNCKLDPKSGTSGGSMKFLHSSSYQPYVIFPQIDVERIQDIQFSFWLYQYTTSYTTKGIIVGVCEQADLSTVTPIDTIFPFDVAAKKFEKHIITFENYTGTGKYIALYAPKEKPTGSTSGITHYIDDIQIDSLYNCNMPEGPECIATKTTSASFRWATTGAKKWQVAVYANEDMTGDAVSSVEVAAAHCTISGLNLCTEYYAFFRAVSEKDTSDWTLPVSFRTHDILTIPYSNDFTDEVVGYGNNSPKGWFLYNTKESASGSYIPYVNSGTWTAATGTTIPAEIVKNSLYFNVSSTNRDAYAVMPELIDTVELRSLIMTFYAHTNTTQTSYGRQLEVGVMTDPNDPETFVKVADVVLDEMKVSQKFFVAFGGYQGAGRYIAFRTNLAKTIQMYVDNIEIDFVSECSEVTNLNVDALTNKDAVISWVKGNKETKWNLKVYDKEVDWLGIDTITATVFDGEVTSNPYTLTGLQPLTNYYVFVQAKTDNCVGNWSQILEFRTLCPDNFEVPYEVNFNKYGKDDIPDCWIVKAGTSSSTLPRVYDGSDCYDYDTGTKEGGRVFRMYSGKNGYSYAILPEVNEPISNLQISFYGWTTKTPDIGYIEIGVMEDIDSTFLDPTVYWTSVPTNDKLFTLIERVELTEMKQWFPILVSFDKYQGKGKHIAFRAGLHVPLTSSTDGYFWLDNLKIDKMPDCRKIGGLEVKDITHQKADLYWDTNEETSWNIKLAKAKINPNVEDTANLVVFEKSTNVMPYTLEGLEANKEYFVYVQGVNSTLNCVGEWSEPLQFISNCAPMALGYTDNFEQYRGKGNVGEGSELRCWIKSGSDNWIAYPFQYNTSNTGRGPLSTDSVCLYMQNASSYNTTLAANNIVTSYLATQALDVDSIEQAQVSFRAYASSSTYQLGQFEIGVMTDPYDPTTYRAVYADTIPYNASDKTEWTYYTVNFLNYTNDDYGDKGKHIVFRCMPGQSKTAPEKAQTNKIYFDDIVIEPYSPCSTPRRLELVEATEKGATFKWQSPEAESYRIIAVPREEANPAIAALDTIVKSNPATITGLKENTNYYVYVQILCEGNNSGSWSYPAQVRTLGCSDALPYYESFEGHNVYISSSELILPYCWQAYSETILADGGNLKDAGYSSSSTPKMTSFPYITTGGSSQPTHSGTYHLLSSNNALSILPDFKVDDVRKLSMHLYYSLSSTLYSLEVGVIEDINDPNSYITLEVFGTDKSYISKELAVDFAKYNVPFNKNSRIALKAVSSGAYIDDVYVNYTDGLWKPANLEFVSATHNSVSFKWNQIGTPDSYDVILVNGNDTITKSFTTSEVTVTDLPAATEYDVYVYAVKDGVRSDVSDEFAVFTYSEPAQLPYSTDFNNAEDNAKWQFYTNGASTNHWMFGNDAYSTDDTALYISSDSVNNVYQVGVASQSWASRTVEVKEAGVYDVAFRTRFNATAANSAHKYKVLFMPSNFVPSSGSLVNPYVIGTGSTAVVLKKSNPLVVLEESFTSNGEWVDYVGKVIVDEPGYYNFSACFVTTTQKTTPKYAPAIDSLRISAATCYAPYNIEIAELLDTTVTLKWDDNKITNWDLIVATESATNPSILEEDAIVVDTLLTSPKAVLSTLASMTYHVYLKASCDTEWTIFEFETPCQQVVLPYINDFGSYEKVSSLSHVDGTCWNTSYSKLTLNTTYHSPEVKGDTTMDIKSGYEYVMPLMPEEIKNLEIEFEMAHASGTTAPTRFELGVVTDPFNSEETFEALESFNCPGVFTSSNQMEFGKFYYNFSNYKGNGRYIAFRSPNGGFYLDDIIVSKLPACPRPYNLKATGITSTSATISWLAMADQNSWVVAVANKEMSVNELDSLARTNGFIFMDTVATQVAKVTGIPHTTTLYAYVKSNCDGDGAWSKALEFNSGFAIEQLPYSEDFQTIAEDQLPLAWARYDIDYDDVKAGESLKPASRSYYGQFAVNIVNQKPDTLHSIYTTLYKSKDAANVYRWVVGPEIKVSEKAILSFDLKFAGSNYLRSLSNFNVLVSNNDGASWSVLATFANRLNAEYHFADYFNAYKRVFIELDQYIGDTIRFAFYTEGLDENTVQVNIDNISVKPATVYDYTDTGFEKRDYEGYGFAFDYSEMNPGVKEATRYAAGKNLETNDSIINIDVAVLPILRTEIVDMMCPGDLVYAENGFSVSEIGVYQQRHVVASGADSVVTLTLGLFDGETEFAISETIKEGEFFPFGGENLTETGVYTDSLVNQYGCDSVVVLT